MRKTFLFIAAMAIAFVSNAQTNAGDVFVGGNLQLGFYGGEVVNGATTTTKNSTTNFNFAPRVGFFLSDKAAVGASVGFNLNRTSTPGGDYNSTSTISFAPFARYYMSVNEQINFYGQGSIGLGFGNSKTVIGNTETDTGDILAFNIGARAGVAFFPSDNVNIDFGLNVLNFSSQNNTDPNTDIQDKNNSLQFGFSSFAPSIGINYFF